jgi:uncharacterized protein (DUF488 family)
VDAIRTVGHGTLEAEELLALLRGAGVAALVDIRRYPGSRHNPQFGADELSHWLPRGGISYQRTEALGGRRRPTANSPNTAWRNDQFAAYADHMASEEFASGIAELKAIAENNPTAIMCSESVWWRCHRRLVADHLELAEHLTVEHLFHDGRVVEHEPMAEARVIGAHIEYPAAQPEPPM